MCGKAFTHLSCAGLLLPALTGQCRERSLYRAGPKVYSQEIDPIDPVKSSVVYTLSVFTQTFALINGINHWPAPPRPRAAAPAQPKCTVFPCANTHYGRRSLHSSFSSARRANFAHFPCNIHAASENEVSRSGHPN